MTDKDADAKAIYAAMLKAARNADPDGKYPEWVEGGNSDMQEEARRVASRLTAERDALRAALTDARACLEGEPEYHHQGMGCGLEDRNITDRYNAMEHGWEQAMERVYGEHINGAIEVIDAALNNSTPRYETAV